MRLEEWQKWLDAQFLDSDHAGTIESNGPPVGEDLQDSINLPSLPPVIDSQTIASLEAGVEHTEEVFETQIVTTVETFSIAATPRPHDPAGAVIGPSAAMPASPPPVRTDSAGDLEMAVPAIEHYLPFLKAKKEAVVSSSPTTTDELTGSAVIEPERELAASKTDTQDASGSPEPKDFTEFEPPPPVRRIGPPNHRSKRGHRVKTDQAAVPMTPEEVWSLVPRHFKALVAMNSDEVAQHSYKRAFKESRVDLIQRLLDPTISLEETARLLNVCPTTVRRYTNRGVLRHQRTVGDQRRFKLSDVFAFLESQSRVSPPQDR